MPNSNKFSCSSPSTPLTTIPCHGRANNTKHVNILCINTNNNKRLHGFLW
jgi:hypothetical protein